MLDSREFLWHNYDNETGNTTMIINKPLPMKPNGKPNTNKDYQSQGWNAAIAGIPESECPYYPTSTAEKYWLKGHREY